MQNIKNFTKYEPSPAQVDDDLRTTGKIYSYLVSEDGLDWYKCQSLFSDTTIKIMYDTESIIRAVVSEPVPERGGIYAVSMFFPDKMSVAEIAEELPEGFELNSMTWLFDGEKVYQDSILLSNSFIAENKRTRNTLLGKVTAAAFAIQSSLVVGNPRENDADNLVILQEYTDKLRDVDITQPKPSWPATPTFLN